MSTTPPPPTTQVEREQTDQAPPSATRLDPVRLAISVGLLVLGAVLALFAFEWMRTTEANRALVVLATLALGTLGVFALYMLLDRLADALPTNWQETVRPWMYVGPALILLTIFLLYPALRTIMLGFQGPNGDTWVGADNFVRIWTDESLRRSVRNTLAWIVVVPTLAVGIGLVFATLADRLRRGEAVAKSLIFLPMAISFVGASVVWRFIYDFQAFGGQIGLLNGIWVGLGNEPVSWLSVQPWNNVLLMVIMVWMQTGFAMVILSAAIKGVPDDIIEAARIDGASELQVFRRITVPSIMSAIVVVTTTMIINVLKIFDIVYVMTGGQAGTEVIAERMIRWFFNFRDQGQGAAIATMLFILVIPVMIWNVKRFRAEEEIR